jgi:hypothetical protein
MFADLNLDSISHTMQQNKVLHELLTKSTDAVLHFQQQRDHDLQQLVAKNNELMELKLAYKELKSELKQLQNNNNQHFKQQQTDNSTTHNSNNNSSHQQIYKPDISRSQLLDDTTPRHSKFMERLINNTSSGPSHSLAASSSSPSSPNPSFSPETIPPGPSGIISPLDLNESASPNQSSTNSDMVSENLRRKLVALAKVSYIISLFRTHDKSKNLRTIYRKWF